MSLRSKSLVSGLLQNGKNDDDKDDNAGCAPGCGSLVIDKFLPSIMLETLELAVSPQRQNTVLSK